MQQPQTTKFLQALIRLEKEATTYSYITLFEVTQLYKSISHYMLALIFAVPFLQPIPLIGFSTLAGIIIMFSGIGIIFNKGIWLPNRLKRLRIRAKTVHKIKNAWEKIHQKIGFFIHKRKLFSNHTLFFRICNGFILCTLGAFISLPLPIPGTNFIPALAVILLCISVIEEDTYTLFVSYIFTIAIYFLLFFSLLHLQLLLSLF